MAELYKGSRYSLRQLRYFLTIAEEGTLSGAAQRLRVSQSAVSLALTELERGLKVQLCVRRKARGVTLTPSGRRVLRQARELLRQAEELEMEALNSDGQLSGPLSVGCFMALAPVVLPRLLQDFEERHPRVTIDFEEGYTQDGLQRRLLAGELDLSILYDVDVQPEIDRVELFRLRPYILLPESHRLADRPVVALRDLAEEPMVLLQAPPSTQHSLMLFHEVGVAPVVRYRVTSFETARALVGRGLGYALAIQRPPVERTYEGLRVVCKDIAELPTYALGVMLAWPRDTTLTRRAREFIRHSLDTHWSAHDRGREVHEFL
ncbi:MAG: LysR substrate-binding domain-containing protein [Streptosporangiaceae bacterium]